MLSRPKNGHGWTYIYLLIVRDYLCQEQALRLQIKLDAVPLVIQKLFQLQVLQSAQGAVISPVHGYLQLPGLVR